MFTAGQLIAKLIFHYLEKTNYFDTLYICK